MNRYVNFILKNISSLLLVLLFSSNAMALEPDSLKTELRPQITILSEFNDNVNLTSESSPNYLDEGMIHFLPRFGIGKSLDNHNFGLAFDSDFRTGMYSAPFQSNLQTAGNVNLNFNNGISLDLNDYYTLTEYDHGLIDLPGITDRQMNNFGSKLSYDITEKFNVYAAYKNRWQTHLNNDNRFNKTSNIFGGGVLYKFTNRVRLNIDYENTQDEYDQNNDLRKRTLNDVRTKLQFPITNSLDLYAAYKYYDQESDKYKIRNFSDNRAVGGLVWNGRNRLKIWAEVGYETIMYQSTLIEDHLGVVGMAGFDLKMTEVINVDFAAGVDGYSEFAFNGNINYDYSNKTNIKLIPNRKSMPLFYSNVAATYYSAYNFQLLFASKLSDYLKLNLGGSLQTRDDFSDDFDIATAGNISQTTNAFVSLDIKPMEKLYIGLSGKYMILKNENESVTSYKYDTWIGKFVADYALNKWGHFGISYQYATRIDDADIFNYNNNRFGIFIKFVF